MKIAVIIVTYNGMRHEWISKCLAAVKNSSVPVEIFVVDNLSTDSTVNYIGDEFPAVHLYAEKENHGFGKANNLAIEKALAFGCTHFFLLNQDAYVQPDTILKLANASIDNPDFGVISPLHLNGDGSALDKDFAEFTSPPWCKNLYSDFAVGVVKNTLYCLDFINAAAWMISKECLRKVGGFSPTFYHYGEDNNYAQRVLFHGFKIGILANTAIYHDRKEVKNPFFDPIKANVRHHVVIWSNPLEERTYYNSEKYLYTQLLFNKFIAKNKERYEITQNLLDYRKKNFKELQANLQISKSDEKYKFLNTNAN